MKKTLITLFVLALSCVGCDVETMRQPAIMPHSEIQALQRGDSVIVRYQYDTTLNGPAIVFGIYEYSRQCVWVQFPDSTRRVLHESFLWRKP